MLVEWVATVDPRRCLPRDCNRPFKAGMCDVSTKRIKHVCPVSLGRFDSGLLLPWHTATVASHTTRTVCSFPDCRASRRYMRCTQRTCEPASISARLALSSLASMHLSAFGHPQPTPGPFLPSHVSSVDRLLANHCQRRGRPNLRGHARSYSSSIIWLQRASAAPGSCVGEPYSRPAIQSGGRTWHRGPWTHRQLTGCASARAVLGC